MLLPARPFAARFRTPALPPRAARGGVLAAIIIFLGIVFSLLIGMIGGMVVANIRSGAALQAAQQQASYATAQATAASQLSQQTEQQAQQRVRDATDPLLRTIVGNTALIDKTSQDLLVLRDQVARLQEDRQNLLNAMTDLKKQLSQRVDGKALALSRNTVNSALNALKFGKDGCKGGDAQCANTLRETIEQMNSSFQSARLQNQASQAPPASAPAAAEGAAHPTVEEKHH